ncbi:MAG: D-alanine--D-alanine ligase [Planctomycetes bacterium]|nr:D-alanine--D-alanine ligase [Planctomycetota bacterium]
MTSATVLATASRMGAGAAVSARSAVRTKVAVLMGGDSSEREVSFESGRAVLEALRGAGLDAVAFDPAQAAFGELLALKPTTAFLALHGKGGEDGTVQRKLEAVGIRYTGCGPEASALAMDKELAKKAFVKRGIPTPAFRVLRRGTPPDKANEAAESLGYPVVVKPVAEGSSIGVSIARNRFALLEGLQKAFAYGPRALVESFVEGREFCVGILGRRCLPVVEIRHADQFFSYKAKYEDNRTSYRFDHALPSTVRAAMEEAALAAFDSLGCRQYSRLDVMLSGKDWTPYVLEVNTLPGMTGHSILPRQALEAGLSFTELCLDILRLAGEDLPSPSPFGKRQG